MTKTSTLILIAALAAPAAAEPALKCPDLKPRARSLKVMRMQPLRRGKNWLAGSAGSINSVSCDMYGMKTGEAEYDGKNLVLKQAYEYRDTEATKAFCAGLKSEEKLTTTFSEEARSSLDDFCRRNKKKDFSMVLVYDDSPSRGKETTRKPIRSIFRIFDKRGFVAEEHSFDPFMTLESVTLYTYDKGNNLTQLAVNDMDGRQLRRETYSWNKPTASRTHSVFGETNQLQRKTVTELREDGTVRRIVRTDYDSGEQPVTRSETYCDAKGAPEKELVYDADEADPKYEYDYSHKLDDKGNWTEERRTRVTVFNGKRMPDSSGPPEITERELLYY
ncbi:MAG: hypothetical protein M0011_10580 [Elusimicrobia bacterium]|nr:hypothetical protein [Elusimicrobiota bacterium]